MLQNATTAFTCFIDECQFKTYLFDDFKDHMYKTHSIFRNLHKCKYCTKRYDQRCQLKQHEKTHLNNGKFKCRHCNQRFPLQSQLNSHRCTVYERQQNEATIPTIRKSLRIKNKQKESESKLISKSRKGIKRRKRKREKKSQKTEPTTKRMKIEVNAIDNKRINVLKYIEVLEENKCLKDEGMKCIKVIDGLKAENKGLRDKIRRMEFIKENENKQTLNGNNVNSDVLEENVRKLSRAPGNVKNRYCQLYKNENESDDDIYEEDIRVNYGIDLLLAAAHSIDDNKEEEINDDKQDDVPIQHFNDLYLNKIQINELKVGDKVDCKDNKRRPSEFIDISNSRWCYGFDGGE